MDSIIWYCMIWTDLSSTINPTDIRYPCLLADIGHIFLSIAITQCTFEECSYYKKTKTNIFMIDSVNIIL